MAKSEQAELIVGSTQDVSITMSNVEVSLLDFLTCPKEEDLWVQLQKKKR